ncbi:sensor histidine kinase [Butyrivibrio proteoclasticus]|uniref:sensor histidine kinase n=1 Tax=Butyrivibrio proteoclasticus TaxID=43305 RepID=UPI0012DFA4D3|nr:HAMP domain-containing sensor histidine kinase [Butyrivibrio proteoclasticus]
MENTGSIKAAYFKLCMALMIALLTVIAIAELAMIKSWDMEENIYKVEISRVERALTEGQYPPDLSGFNTILGVYAYDESGADFYDVDNSYVIREVDGRLYRIEYEVDKTAQHKDSIRRMNIVLAFVLSAVLLIMLYIYLVIIRGFCRIADYPIELSKGNLTTPLKENRNHYFGKFLWGLDMLREKLEQEKQKNLEFQKEKNLFLLSLSHDTKTPLSAIKLYAAAMKKNLYKNPDKQAEIAEKIDEKTNEIEGYISKIITSAGDDFMSFEVNNGEFYLSNVVKEIEKYYFDKFDEVGTKFLIGDYTDALIYGDQDRFTEVMQNLMENAIKYGDGEQVSIDFRDEDGARLVTVSNTGCELKETELEHIFESFYRGTNVGNRSGSGLGLYICKKLMNKMRGDIFAEIDDGIMKVTLVCSK